MHDSCANISLGLAPSLLLLLLFSVGAIERQLFVVENAPPSRQASGAAECGDYGDSHYRREAVMCLPRENARPKLIHTRGKAIRRTLSRAISNILKQLSIKPLK